MQFVDIGSRDIQLIKDLWNKNKEYHIQIEPVFKKQYQEKAFDIRMNEILCDKERIVKITISRDDEEINGYCISGIKNGEGEVISMHVRSNKRNSGIGKELLSRHIKWMKDNNCRSIGVYVADINKETIKFYEKCGFKKNLLLMEISE